MVRVWDIMTGTCKWVLVGHTQKGWYHHKRLHSHCFEKESQFTVWFSILLAVKRVQALWTAQYGSGT